MTERNELVGQLVPVAGGLPRFRAVAGPGWIAGDHGQDLTVGLEALTAPHGGTWELLTQEPAARVARCSAKACGWKTPPIPAHRAAPTKCETEGCKGQVRLDVVPEAGLVIVLQQVTEPGKGWHAERAFRMAPAHKLVQAARTWAQAELEEQGLTPMGTLQELLSGGHQKAKREELRELVLRGLAAAADAAPKKAKGKRAKV